MSALHLQGPPFAPPFPAAYPGARTHATRAAPWTVGSSLSVVYMACTALVAAL